MAGPHPAPSSTSAHLVAIGLGTNLGDRLGQLVAARTALASHLSLAAVSPIYTTPPWGVLDQPWFLNAACLGTTTLLPHELLARLKMIEQELGRTAGLRWGPRLIDLDLLWYADCVLDSPTLTLPHRDLHRRAFVLVPLADLALDWRHPRLGRTIAELLADTDRSAITLAATQWPS